MTKGSNSILQKYEISILENLNSAAASAPSSFNAGFGGWVRWSLSFQTANLLFPSRCYAVNPVGPDLIPVVLERTERG